jgi:hypothetical protein
MSSNPFFFSPSHENLPQKNTKSKGPSDQASKHVEGHIVQKYTNLWKQASRPEWTHTDQCTIHWMPITTQLWMNLNSV